MSAGSHDASVSCNSASKHQSIVTLGRGSDIDAPTIRYSYTKQRPDWLSEYLNDFWWNRLTGNVNGIRAPEHSSTRTLSVILAPTSLVADERVPMEHPEVMPVAMSITNMRWHSRMSVRTSFNPTPHAAMPMSVRHVSPAAEVVYLRASVRRAERIECFSFIKWYVTKYMAPV